MQIHSLALAGQYYKKKGWFYMFFLNQRGYMVTGVTLQEEWWQRTSGRYDQEEGNEEVEERQQDRYIDMDNKELKGSEEVEEMQREEVEDRGLGELRHWKV